MRHFRYAQQRGRSVRDHLLWRGQPVADVTADRIWPGHRYDEDLPEVIAAMQRPKRAPQPLRFMLDRARNDEAFDRWRGRRTASGRFRTLVGRALVSLSRRL